MAYKEKAISSTTLITNDRNIRAMHIFAQIIMNNNLSYRLLENKWQL